MEERRVGRSEARDRTCASVRRSLAWCRAAVQGRPSVGSICGPMAGDHPSGRDPEGPHPGWPRLPPPGAPGGLCGAVVQSDADRLTPPPGRRSTRSSGHGRLFNVVNSTCCSVGRGPCRGLPELLRWGPGHLEDGSGHSSRSGTRSRPPRCCGRSADPFEDSGGPLPRRSPDRSPGSPPDHSSGHRALRRSQAARVRRTQV